MLTSPLTLWSAGVARPQQLGQVLLLYRGLPFNGAPVVSAPPFWWCLVAHGGRVGWGSDPEGHLWEEESWGAELSCTFQFALNRSITNV